MNKKGDEKTESIKKTKSKIKHYVVFVVVVSNSQ